MCAYPVYSAICGIQYEAKQYINKKPQINTNHHGICVDSAVAVAAVVARVVVVVVAELAVVAVVVVAVVAEASRSPLGVVDVDYCNVCCRHGFLEKKDVYFFYIRFIYV